MSYKAGILFCILAINMVILNVNCQFYVEIEHSLPRLGKRLEESSKRMSSQMNDELSMISSQKAFPLEDQLQEMPDRELSEEQIRAFLMRAIHLIKMLNQHRQQQQQQQPQN